MTINQQQYHQNTADRTEVLKESTSLSHTATNGTKVPDDAKTTQPAEHKSCKNNNINLIPTQPETANIHQHQPTINNHYNPDPTHKILTT